MKSFQPATVRILFTLVFALAFAARLHGTVTNVAWYRLGENDPGAVSGSTVTNTTTDLIGTNHLKQFASPRYTNAVAAVAASQVGSSRSVNFNGTSQYLSNAVVSTATNNFGIEAWVKPNATDSGNRTIVYNGNPLESGWGFIQRAGTEYRGSLGTMTAFGPGTAAAGVWAHLALVRDNGTTTFYVNGVASGTSVGNPIPPAGGFIVAAHPQFVANTWFNGAVDELRVFTFAPGQFSTNDLLFNVQRITTLSATSLNVASARLNGSVNAMGFPTFAWFEWGGTTNYGYTTTPQSVGAGLASTNFAQTLSELVPHAFHYRAVCSNILGVVRGTNMTFVLTNTASGTAGGGQPVALGQPSIELNYIICTNGNYSGSGDSAHPPFYGEVRLFAGNFAPAGWAFSHGQLINITDNLALFSLMGTAHGGDYPDTFALPDTRGRAMVTAGQGPGLLPIILGEQSGAAQSTIFSSSIPVHTHSLPSPSVGNSGSAGSGAPRANRQPYIGLTSVIYLLGQNPGGAQTDYEPFLGEMTFFAGDFGFNNAARAEGQTLSIANFTALYSILRTNFGGNGTSTFGLPDLRGRFATHPGQGPGLSPHFFGEKFGVETVTMTVGQMPSHQHTLPAVPPIVRLTGFTGSNQSQPLVQPTLAVKFLISTNGEVPSPSMQATNKMISQIQLYAGTNLPVGWTPCEGELLSVAASPALFGVISNFYGGDGVTTFALPDLRSRIPVGSPTGQPGATYGAEQFTLTEAQLPPHTHGVPAVDYQSWCDLLGLAGPEAAFDADADGDGAPNGFEWATGTELTNANSSSSLTIAAVGNEAKVGFSRNTIATDVTIHLQRTTALGNTNAWSGLVTNTIGLWNPASIVSETGSNSVKSVEVSDWITNYPAADYRLKITRP